MAHCNGLAPAGPKFFFFIGERPPAKFLPSFQWSTTLHVLVPKQRMWEGIFTACWKYIWYVYNWTCLVKRSRNQFSDCCFATAGPTMWNSLPEQLRQLDITFGQFKRSLKMFMFG